MSRKKEKRTGGTGEINWKRIEELLNQKWKNGNTYFYKQETCTLWRKQGLMREKD